MNNETNETNSQARVGKSKMKRVIRFLNEAVAYLWWSVRGIRKRKEFLAVFSGVLLVLVAAIIAISSMRSPTAISTSMRQIDVQRQKIAQLNRIETEIRVLTSEINRIDDPSKQKLASVMARFDRIQKVVKNLATQSGVQKVRNLVEVSNNNLSREIADLLTFVKQLKKQFTPIAYLQASVLPFKLISIDIWNGVPYVTVKIDDHAALIGKNETRSGWLVTKLDYDAQEAIFKNHKNQFVRVYINN